MSVSTLTEDCVRIVQFDKTRVILALSAKFGFPEKFWEYYRENRTNTLS